MAARNRLALLCASMLAALSIGAHAQTLSIGIQNEPNTLDPQWNLVGNNTQAMRNIYDTLSARDRNLQLVPSLALSWRAVDDTTWEYKLRPGVKFHDGSDFTAEDVKFTIARVGSIPGNPNSYAVYVGQIREVVVVDPLTVRFVTNGPAPLLPTNLSNIFILSSRNGPQPNGDFNTGKAAIGTGPFRVVSWQPGSPLVLRRNDAYWGDRQPWQDVRFVPISRDSARVAALLAGDIDFINRVPIADLARLRQDPKIRVFAGDSAYVYMLFPDVENDSPQGVRDIAGNPVAKNPFKDARVRRALSLAINRQAIVDRTMEGQASVANQAVPAGFFGHSTRIAPASFDAERARALLAEAGYRDGFQVDLSCPNDRFANDAKICEAVAQFLVRIGIRTQVSAMPSAVFFPRRGKKEFGLHMAGWGSLTGESSYFLGAQVHTARRDLGLGAINTNGISDPEIDALVQEARPVLDEARRRAILEKAMELAMERGYIIPAVTFQVLSAGRADRVSYATRADEETLAAEIAPAR
ncbi:MAG: ABC transporter substrate-binding protein [Alphaproteobacteria bacterium]|jgi:peptide/nickel transport system substrate-binding protein